MVRPVSVNARLGAFALLIGSSVQLIASIAAAMSAPWAYAGWLIFAFGAMCFCQELGPARPLNRAGLILLAATVCFRSFLVLELSATLSARAKLAFVLAGFGAMLFWSVALMHRTERAHTVGVFGLSIAGGGIVLLLSAHLALGIAGIAGFVKLFDAVHQPDADYSQALVSISILLSLWSLAVAWLLLTTLLQSSSDQATVP